MPRESGNVHKVNKSQKTVNHESLAAQYKTFKLSTIHTLMMSKFIKTIALAFEYCVLSS